MDTTGPITEMVPINWPSRSRLIGTAIVTYISISSPNAMIWAIVWGDFWVTLGHAGRCSLGYGVEQAMDAAWTLIWWATLGTCHVGICHGLCCGLHKKTNILFSRFYIQKMISVSYLDHYTSDSHYKGQIPAKI